MGFWFFRYDDFVVIVHDNICSMKTCVDCKKILSLDNFYWHKQNSNYYNRCKICENIRTNKWKNENKEKNIESDHKYINSEKGYVNETIVGIFTRARKNNKRKKWPPNCTKQDIYDELMLYIQDHGKNCEYCKQPWTYIRKKGTSRGKGPVKRGKQIDTNFSIDRLDATKTYEISNLVFCCAGCNNRKNQVRLSDLVNIVRVWMDRRCKNDREAE